MGMEMCIRDRDKADAEGSQYGGINAGANDVHLPAVGMRCLDIVNANSCLLYTSGRAK